MGGELGGGARSRELCGPLCLSLTLLQKTSHLETELGGPALQQPGALTKPRI